MREALLRKRYGVPAAFLIVLAFSGVALAWYCFATISSGTTVVEPLSATTTIDFSDEMYPGETNTWSFDIANSADVTYMVKADLTYSASNGVSITSFTVAKPDSTKIVYASGLADGYSVEFPILANETLSCSMTIKAANDASPGDVSATFKLYRD